MQDYDLSPEMKFGEAARRWVAWSKPYCRKSRTHEMNEYYTGILGQFFGEIELQLIHIGHIRNYQEWRQQPAENGEPQAGPSAINHEISVLGRILDRADLWAALKRYYRPLPLPRWRPPRVLDQESKERLFRIAALKPEWETAFLAAVLTVNTTAAGCELRDLKTSNVDYEERLMKIPDDSVKNEFRGRVVYLNDFAFKAVLRLTERSLEWAHGEKDVYLFPFRVKKGTYDPSKPASSWGWRTAWRSIRIAAGLPWVRLHDLRHQIITELLEDPSTSEETVKAIAGHVSKKILEEYSHIRIAAKRDALTRLSAMAPAFTIQKSSGVYPKGISEFKTHTFGRNGMMVLTNSTPRRSRKQADERKGQDGLKIMLDKHV